MKSTLKVGNLNSSSDVTKINKIISNQEGILACQISKEKKQVNVVYDEYFTNADDIIQNLEDNGYTIL